MANPKINVTKETILQIAALAKLNFTEQELENFEKEFASILEYIDQIKECDTEGINDVHNLDDYVGEVLAKDETKPSLDTQSVFLNSGNRKQGDYFRTSKIINKE